MPHSDVGAGAVLCATMKRSNCLFCELAGLLLAPNLLLNSGCFLFAIAAEGAAAASPA
jgi:hypothetical protein